MIRCIPSLRVVGPVLKLIEVDGDGEVRDDFAWNSWGVMG